MSPSTIAMSVFDFDGELINTATYPKAFELALQETSTSTQSIEGRQIQHDAAEAKSPETIEDELTLTGHETHEEWLARFQARRALRKETTAQQERMDVMLARKAKPYYELQTQCDAHGPHFEAMEVMLGHIQTHADLTEQEEVGEAPWLQQDDGVVDQSIREATQQSRDEESRLKMKRLGFAPDFPSSKVLTSATMIVTGSSRSLCFGNAVADFPSSMRLSRCYVLC